MHLSDQSYLAIREESTVGVALIPNVFVPLVSESIKTVVNQEVDRRIRGTEWKGSDIIRGNRSHEGEIKVYGDADTIGHFLNMIMVKDSTTGNGTDGYTHAFSVGNGSTYTIEIKKGQYAQRYFGVRIEELKLEFEDNILVLTASIKAMGQVGVMSLGVACAGTVTSVTLDDNYDLAPNRGLVSGDVLVVGATEVTLSSINSNGLAVGFSSTSITESAGANVYLKPQTVAQPNLQDPLYMGNLLVGFGADASASATASSSRSTATPIYELALSFKFNLFAQNGSSRFDPVQIIPRTKEASITLKQIFANSEQRQKFLDRSKQAITLVFLGKNIKSDFSTQEKFTITFNNVKMLDHNNAIEVGELIMDEQEFEALYDTTDGQAMEVELVNRTSAY